jgi:restriction endonuclease S subunit
LYKELLEGLEISVLSLDEVLESSDIFRFDPEYFGKVFLENENKVLNGKFEYLENLISLVTDGKHGGVSLQEEGVLFLRSTNVKEGVIDLSDTRYISHEESAETLRAELNSGDILLTTIGSIVGESVVIPQNFPKATINQNLVKITPIDTSSSEYISTFFNSKFGRNQIYRFAAGNIWFLVNYPNLKKIKIPLFSESFYLAIKNILRERETAQETSKALYQEAEALLLTALGIDESIFKNTDNEVVSNIKTFADFTNSWRLDAEYYQPKYDLTDRLVQENAEYIKTINEISMYNARGLQPIYDEYGELDVINSRHILEQELDYSNFEKTSITSWETQIRARIYRSDILTYTTGANIGRTQVYSSSEKALASNHVNILRIKNENPIYVAFVMNSKIGRLQTEKLSAGSAQQELYPKDIDQFYIPFVAKSVQDTICTKIEESQNLKTQSESLLAAAKRAVERAIEAGEAAAMLSIEV